jgi:DNA repair ATPase RecN
MQNSLKAETKEVIAITNQAEGQATLAAGLIKTAKGKQRTLLRLDANLEEALLVAQEVAQQTQEELEYQVSTLVTSALESIFPDPYEFKVEFDIKRGKTEAVLFFTRDGEVIDPLTAAGGGVVEVAAFALRLSCFLISLEKPPPIIIMDEPFACVSEEYQPAVVALLEEMSEKLGIQIICVTHLQSLKVGNVIEL